MDRSKEYWIRLREPDQDGFSEWQVHRSGVWLTNKEAASRFTHVIEYSAYEQLRKENEKLKDNTQKDFKDIQELKTIIKEMSDHSKGYGHCGMDMFAHTKWRKFADELK